MPNTQSEQAFLAMVADFEALDPGNAEFYTPARLDFSAYVQSLLDEERGLNPRNDWVPCTHRWLCARGGQIVGVARLRHNIATPFLFKNAGHIGYDVAPGLRGKGYGHTALRVALAEAERQQLDRVLLVTGEGNAPSRAVIERHGGVLESIGYSEFWHEQLCRYWINVPTHG